MSDVTELCAVDGRHAVCQIVLPYVCRMPLRCVRSWWPTGELFESAYGEGRRDYMEDYASVVPSMMIGTVPVSMVAVFDVRRKQCSFTGSF